MLLLEKCFIIFLFQYRKFQLNLFYKTCLKQTVLIENNEKGIVNFSKQQKNFADLVKALTIPNFIRTYTITSEEKDVQSSGEEILLQKPFSYLFTPNYLCSPRELVFWRFQQWWRNKRPQKGLFVPRYCLTAELHSQAACFASVDF